MKKVIKLTESDLTYIIKQVISEEFDYKDVMNSDEHLNPYELASLVKRMDVDLKSYYENNKETIDKYNQFKRDIDKQRHIENPKFSLQLSNKERHPSIVASVKFPFEYKGKVSKYKFISINVGGKKRFPELLDTPNVFETAKEIIIQKLKDNT